MEEETAQKIVRKKYTKGDILMKKGERVTELVVIMSGTVEAKDETISLTNQPGTIMGLYGLQDGRHLLEYSALEDVEVCIVDYKEMQDVKSFFEQGSRYRQFAMNGTCRRFEQLINMYSMEKLLIDQCSKYIKKQYGLYCELCNKIGHKTVQSKKLQDVKAFSWDMGDLEELVQYLTEFYKLSKETQQVYFEVGDTMAIRHLRDISNVAGLMLKGCEKQLDALKERLGLLCGDDEENLFSLYMDLLKGSNTPEDVRRKVLEDLRGLVNLYEKIEFTVINKMYFLLEQTSVKYKSLYENIAGFYQLSQEDSASDTVEQAERPDPLEDVSGLMEKLLKYSELDEDFQNNFREFLQKYKDMKDKSSTENEDRITRNRLTNLFYDLYQTVFLKSEKEEQDNACLRLFLNYGIVDETLLKPATIELLLAHELKGLEEMPVHVYTIRQWLHEIYIGNKEPSKNDFDQDYEEYLREKNKGNKAISPEEKVRQNAPEEKVKFEIQNFFIMNNRLVSGRLLSFCPILTEADLKENILSQLVTAEKVNQAFKKVLELDFSVFYRDVMYDDRDNGITNLIIHQEILPDVICMPSAGTLGRMWQEISGKKRATPGRFTMPLLLKDDIDKITLQMIGKFRWEICKRVQGSYWNDVSEPSLTSEFCDYLQFYKKNRDLSDKAKEKLGQMLVKCRNNYGDVFVTQYVIWIMSESAGNVRLDKVARNILGRFCPFNSKIRSKLIQQPMFTEAVNRYEKERKKHVKELNNRRAAIRNKKGKETEEFLKELEYFEM